MKHLKKLEVRKMLEIAADDSQRNWLMILVAYLHGMRASEVCGHGAVLRPYKGETQTVWPLRGIDVKDGEITIRRLKGSLKTRQPLVSSPDPLFNEREAIEKLASQHSGVLFPITRVQFWKIVQKYGKLAGISSANAHPHIMKHSIAMHSIKAGIENVRQHLGHKSLSSTGEYLKVDDDVASTAIFGEVGLAPARALADADDYLTILEKQILDQSWHRE